jgi:plastocyanin
MHVLSLSRLLGIGVATAALLAPVAQSDAALRTPASTSRQVVQIPLFVGIRLVGETSFTSPTYGFVQGYFRGTTSTQAQVVVLPPNTDIIFKNVDGALTHTASFLGDATASGAPWPSSFIGSEPASPAGTPIGTTNWSTGPLAKGQSSAKYTSGAPGFYMIGCFFHYVADEMRTVVIVT